jgi:hypothetical protein
VKKKKNGNENCEKKNEKENLTEMIRASRKTMMIQYRLMKAELESTMRLQRVQLDASHMHPKT